MRENGHDTQTGGEENEREKNWHDTQTGGKGEKERKQA